MQATDDGGFAMALQADSKIVVGGYSVDPVNGDKEFALVRYNYNGTLDTTFDGDGKVVTDFNNTSDRIWGIAIQADNKIVAVGETFNSGNSTNDVAIARFNADGSLDAATPTEFWHARGQCDRDAQHHGQPWHEHRVVRQHGQRLDRYRRTGKCAWRRHSGRPASSAGSS